MNINLHTYNNAIAFAATMLGKSKAPSRIDKIDIVHNIIINEMVNELNYKSLIIGEIKKEIGNSTILFNETKETKQLAQKRCCRICGIDTYEGYFKVGFNKRDNIINYRNICNICHNKTRKRYSLSEKTKEKITLKRKERRAAERKKYGHILDPTRNERVKRYWNKQKELMSDAWIKKSLVSRKLKSKDITKEMIENKRSQLLISLN